MVHEIDVDCPSCKSKLQVKVPAKSGDAPAEKPAEDPIAKRLAAIEAKTQALPEDFCTKFPDLCSGVASLRDDVRDIKARQTEQAEASEHAHYAPTEELFDHWLSCPDCKGKADNLAKRLAERSKAPEIEPEPEPEEKPIESKPTPAPEPVIEKTDDNDSVWNKVMR